jgi:NitT/TauT family transport system permease protein
MAPAEPADVVSGGERSVLATTALWLRSALPVAGAFVALIVLWQIATVVGGVPSYVLPPPTLILEAIAENWRTLIVNGAVTLAEAAAGFLLSIVVGVPLGVAIVYSRWLDRVLYPLLVASQSIPKVALAPIFVVWFGFGALPKVLIAFSIAFFAIVVNTVVGMKRTPQEMIFLMRSLGASRLQIFARVRLPVAAPYIFAGIKISATFAIVGAIVGEFIAASSGLGYLQLVANNNFQIPLLFGILVLLSVLGGVLYGLVVIFERLILPPPLRAVKTDEAGATL